MKNQMKILMVVILSSLLFFSCSDDDSNPVNGGDNGNGESMTVVKGRVTDNGGYGDGLQKISGSVEGATVTTAEIQSDGSLQTTSTSSVQTNADGEFEVVTNSTGKTNVVVVATKGSSEWRAIISSEIKSNQENSCPPLNSETTAEAKIYADIVADGETSIVDYADVAFYVNSQIAVMVNNDESERKKVKEAMVNEERTRKKAMTDPEYGNSVNDYEKSNEIERESQKDFEEDTNQGDDSEQSYNSAWQAYFTALINGYSTTSVKMSHYAQFEEISGKAMINLNATLSSDTKFHLMKRNAYLKAKILAEAMVKAYEKAGASEEEKMSVMNENDNLIASIRVSTSESDIDKAYDNYRTEIKANMKSSFEASAAAFTIIDSTIEASIKTTLETTINTAASVGAIVNAYSTFYGSVKSTVSSELSISDTAQFEAFADIYALIYMHN